MCVEQENGETFLYFDIRDKGIDFPPFVRAKKFCTLIYKHIFCVRALGLTIKLEIYVV